MPPVISRIASTPASPRSATMSVAPKAVASCWRDSWRDIATIRSAPSSLAAMTPHRPTAPSPMTTAVLPGRTREETAACQPVAMTSARVSSDGRRASSGTPSVATRVPSAWCTLTSSACPDSVQPWLAQTEVIPARQCGHVLSLWQNGMMTKSPAAKDRTSAPTSATMPTASWPMVEPAVISFSPR